jgi:hypothetical protein
MSVYAAAGQLATESMQKARTRGRVFAQCAAFGCGISAAFSVNLLGELFVSEILLPVAAAILLSLNYPAGLFANRTFRVLMLVIVLMLVGYMFSDLVAGTPRDMYLRGWARVASFGTSAFSLSVLCYVERRCLVWFCAGLGIGGIAEGLLAGMPLTRWKLGYGEKASILILALSGFVRPLWLSAIVIALLGSVSILLDYRSLGVLLMLVAVSVLLRASGVDLRQFWRRLPVLLAGVLAIAFAANWLLKQSEGDYSARRAVSNISRFAAIRVGALAVADSPILGYGSWGQGTEKYAEIYYNDVIDGLTAADPELLMDRGGYFTAHSQIIQAWMEGGLLAGAFFVTYIWLLVHTLLRCVRWRPVDYLMPVIVYVVASNLWDSIMSPFLGLTRISLAMAIAAIIVVETERQVVTDPAQAANSGIASIRPVNLMR